MDRLQSFRRGIWKDVMDWKYTSEIETYEGKEVKENKVATELR